jgi:calcineurin-binding protein cabin-1
MKPIEPPIQPVIKNIISESLSRRVSQESAITTTTTTTSTRTSSSSDSSADSSSDSDSSSSDETTDGADKENVFVSQETINEIYKMCIKNLEECVTRFPEHYKSIYRLVHHNLTVGNNIEICKQLLLKSDYKSALGNKISGLFTERKNNNFFNGIWRSPSQEIDRPGNFTTHLSKCVIVLMEVLKKTNDYETLMDLAMQLQRNPDADKKYLNDQDRKDLFQQAVACCVQAFKNKLREITSGKVTDKQLIDLMLDIFKAHRKTFKIFQQKDQNQFANVLVDVYKEYIKDKVALPENANHNDLAFKLCQSEINYRKNLEKGIIPSSVVQPPHHLPTIQPSIASSIPPSISITTTSSPSVAAAPSPTPLLIKSVSEINKSVEPPKSSQSPAASSKSSTPTSTSNSTQQKQSTKSKASKSQSSNSNMMSSSINQLLQLYSNPAMLQQLQMSQLSSLDTNALFNEYMKSMMSASPMSSLSSMTPQQQLAMLSMSDPMMASLMASSYGSMSPKSSSPKSSPKTGTTSKNNEQTSTKATKQSSTSTSSSSGSTLHGFKQNLLSNSLTITTTTMTTSTSSKATMSKAQQSSKKSTSKEPSLSISKSDTNLTASKYSSYFGSNLNLPDLPKSLSITPSIPAPKQKQQPAQEKQPSKLQQQQQQQQKQQQKSMQNLYNRSISNLTENSLSSLNMKAYTEFLNNYNKATSTLPIPKQQQQRSMTSASSSSGSGSSGIGGLKLQSKQKNSTQNSHSQVKKNIPVQPVVKASTQIPYDFGKNIASSFSNPSPGLSISPFPPSPSISPSSNSKTLQQKLAERKRKQQKQKDGEF